MFWMGFIKDDFEHRKMPWHHFHHGQKKGPMYRIGMIETENQNFLFPVRVYNGGDYDILLQWALCFDAIFSGAQKVALDTCGYHILNDRSQGIKHLWIAERLSDRICLTYASVNNTFITLQRPHPRLENIDYDSFSPDIPEAHGHLLPKIPAHPEQPTVTVPLTDIKHFFDQQCLHLFPGRTADDAPWSRLRTLQEVIETFDREWPEAKTKHAKDSDP